MKSAAIKSSQKVSLKTGKVLPPRIASKAALSQVVIQKPMTGGVSLQKNNHCMDLLCASCQGSAKSVKREFSAKAWAALVCWHEISEAAVDQPICNDCYMNLRDVLIDRAEDVQAQKMVTPLKSVRRVTPSLITATA